jgi:hypothetical protein
MSPPRALAFILLNRDLPTFSISFLALRSIWCRRRNAAEVLTSSLSRTYDSLSSFVYIYIYVYIIRLRSPDCIVWEEGFLFEYLLFLSLARGWGWLVGHLCLCHYKRIRDALPCMDATGLAAADSPRMKRSKAIISRVNQPAQKPWEPFRFRSKFKFSIEFKKWKNLTKFSKILQGV